MTKKLGENILIKCFQRNTYGMFYQSRKITLPAQGFQKQYLSLIMRTCEQQGVLLTRSRASPGAAGFQQNTPLACYLDVVEYHYHQHRFEDIIIKNLNEGS